MILSSIFVSNFGDIKHLSQNFESGLNVVKVREPELLLCAVQIVLNSKKTPSLPPCAVGADTRIEGIVALDEKRYNVIAEFSSTEKALELHAYDGVNSDVTNEYIRLTEHCAEHNLSDFFDGNDENCSLGFLKYANEDIYYGENELSRRTNRLSELKVFRAYVRDFIKNFRSEVIREGKSYEIIMKKDGRYGVRCKGMGDLPPMLSESESILFRYLCFLRTAEFWRGFEKMRNVHDIKKPLLIENFVDKLDETIDLNDIIKRTMGLGRQVILLK